LVDITEVLSCWECCSPALDIDYGFGTRSTCLLRQVVSDAPDVERESRMRPVSQRVRQGTITNADGRHCFAERAATIEIETV
jgi:hypothetical protein